MVKVGGKLFRYRDGMVEYVVKATAEDIVMDEDWKKSHGYSLFGIVDGYMVLDSAGLSKENWDNKEARKEYLEAFADEIDEETSYLVAEAVKELA